MQSNKGAAKTKVCEKPNRRPNGKKHALGRRRIRCQFSPNKRGQRPATGEGTWGAANEGKICVTRRR